MIFPENPTVGDEWTEPTNNLVYVYTSDTVWSLKSPEINDAVVTDAVIDPTLFTDGKRWVDPDDAISSVKITDGGGQEVWVQDGTGLIPSSWTTWVAAPAAASDPGVIGNVAEDATYFYVYTPAGSWIRMTKAAF